MGMLPGMAVFGGHQLLQVVELGGETQKRDTEEGHRRGNREKREQKRKTKEENKRGNRERGNTQRENRESSEFEGDQQTTPRLDSTAVHTCNHGSCNF